MSTDNSLRVWNAATGAQLLCIDNACDETIVSLAFDYDGARVATTSKDGALSIFDIRTGELLAQLSAAHRGKLDAGVTWLGDREWLFTIGFGSGIGREWAVWQLDGGTLRELSRGDFESGSGVVQPMFDEATSLVMCAGKGDSSIGSVLSLFVL